MTIEEPVTRKPMPLAKLPQCELPEVVPIHLASTRVDRHKEGTRIGLSPANVLGAGGWEMRALLPQSGKSHDSKIRLQQFQPYSIAPLGE
jgi:hypothetical protein